MVAGTASIPCSQISDVIVTLRGYKDYFSLSFDLIKMLLMFSELIPAFHRHYSSLSGLVLAFVLAQLISRLGT